MYKFFTWTKKYYSRVWSDEDDEASSGTSTPRGHSGSSSGPRSLSAPATDRGRKVQHNRSSAVDWTIRRNSVDVPGTGKAFPVVSTVTALPCSSEAGTDPAPSASIGQPGYVTPVPYSDDDQAVDSTEDNQDYNLAQAALQRYEFRTNLKGTLRLNEDVIDAAKDLTPESASKLVDPLEAENKKLAKQGAQLHHERLRRRSSRDEARKDSA